MAYDQQLEELANRLAELEKSSIEEEKVIHVGGGGGGADVAKASAGVQRHD